MWLVLMDVGRVDVDGVDAGLALTHSELAQRPGTLLGGGDDEAPLDSNSHRWPNSARSLCHTECEYGAGSSSWPVSLSETSRFPSQALLVPQAIWPRSTVHSKSFSCCVGSRRRLRRLRPRR